MISALGRGWIFFLIYRTSSKFEVGLVSRSFPSVPRVLPLSCNQLGLDDRVREGRTGGIAGENGGEVALGRFPVRNRERQQAEEGLELGLVRRTRGDGANAF